jgi:hypothetical protein
VGHKVAAFAVLVAAASCASAQAEIAAWGVGFGASSDSDGLRARRASVAGYTRFEHAERYTGLRLEYGSYRQGDWERAAQGVAVVHSDADPHTLAGLKLSTGLSRVGDRNLVTADGNWSRETGGGIRIEIFLDREWVDTARALEDGIHFDFAGASVDKSFGDRLTIVGLIAYQRFSDGNERLHRRSRAIFGLWPEAGLSLQARYRDYTSSLENAQGRYFNPERYREALAVLALRRRLAGRWTLSAEAGTGRQYVADDPGSPARVAALAATRALDGGGVVRLRAGYYRSANYGGPDYRYRQLVIDAAVPF